MRTTIAAISAIMNNQERLPTNSSMLGLISVRPAIPNLTDQSKSERLY